MSDANPRLTLESFIIVLPELPRRQQVVGPLFDISDADIESWRDNSAFVEPPSEVDDNLAASVIVNDFELPNVTVFHHNGEEADNHFGGRSDKDLPLATLLSVVNGLKSAGEGVHQHHDECRVSAIKYFNGKK